MLVNSESYFAVMFAHFFNNRKNKFKDLNNNNWYAIWPLPEATY